MKLHPFDVELAMPHSHDETVIRRCGDLKRRWKAFSFNDEAVVASRSEWRVKILEDARSVVRDL